MRSTVTYSLIMCAAISSMFARTASMIVAATTNDVRAATEMVLAGWHVPVQEHGASTIVSKKVEVAVSDITNYIVENQPDEAPGWTKARVWFHITTENNGSITEVGVVAFFERYGTRSAFMLIPPSWIAVPSNGILEQKFLVDIKKALATEGGAR